MAINTNCRRYRALSGVPLMLTFACIGSDATPESGAGGAFEILPFEEMFRLESVATLTVPDSEIIGNVTDLVHWRDRLVVVDQTESKVWAFDSAGSYLISIGRPGDGPGEFRTPMAAAEVTDGHLAVVDRALRVSFVDANGKYVRRFELGGSAFGGFEAIDGGNHLMIAARLPTLRGDQNDASDKAVHIVDLRGAVVRRLRERSTPTQWYEMNFNTIIATVADSTVISVERSSNQVHHFDLRTGQERRIAVAEGIYEPPRWPTGPIDDMSAMRTWANNQTWTMRLMPAGQSEYIVRFSRFHTDSGRAMVRYALVRLDGTVIAVTEPTSAIIMRISSDRAYSAFINDFGDAEVRSYSFRRPR